MNVNDYDLSRTVPAMTVTYLAFTCFFAVVVPLLGAYICKKKFRGKLHAFFYGVSDYLVMEYMLCNLVLVGLLLIPGLGTSLESTPILYILTAAALTSVIFEAGRYFILGVVKKYDLTLANVFIFSVGTAGAFSIFKIASSAFQSMVVAFTINDAGLPQLVEEAGENAESLLALIDPLISNPSYIYLINGIDTLLAFVFHLAMSVILFVALKKEGPRHLLAIAVGIRFLYELPGYFLAYSIIFTNAVLAEAVILMITAGAGYFAYKLAFEYLAHEIDALTQKEQSPFPKFPSRPGNAGSIRNNANIMAGKNKKDNNE